MTISASHSISMSSCATDSAISCPFCLRRVSDCLILFTDEDFYHLDGSHTIRPSDRCE
jgi:hypothetical protein